MEKYSPEEVKELLTMLNSINSRVKKNKNAEPTKLEKQIHYLEQRLHFFNPSKETLKYLIQLAENSKVELDPILLQKLKTEFANKV